jgi:hypothetical protein
MISRAVLTYKSRRRDLVRYRLFVRWLLVRLLAKTSISGDAKRCTLMPGVNPQFQLNSPIAKSR